MSDPKTLPQVPQDEQRLLRLIPVVTAMLLVAGLWLVGSIRARQHTLDCQAIVSACPQYLININTAHKGDLMLLPGIGRTLAQRIVDYRDANGPFTSNQQLVRIWGISDRTLARFDGFLMPLDDDAKPIKKRQDAESAP